ncbi:MerR family transcriptional regulator [Georhizobium profundi]|uniref:MerR family transcriptional regulator n=1 Tax=Georhizobium profundi TaxID=2341112 RepID=UPI0026D62013
MRSRQQAPIDEIDRIASHAAETDDGAFGPEDQLFRIGDLAAEFGVTLRTLRFYEDKDLLQPRRIGVTRLYSRRDRARLKLILLGKRLGFSLEEVRRMIELYDPEGRNKTQLKVALDKGGEQLQRLKDQRMEIDTAIRELEQTMAVVREMLSSST